MDPNSNQIPGVNLPPTTGGQAVSGVFAGATDPAAGNTPLSQQQAAAPAALPIQVEEEAASDEELDQVWVNKAKDIVEQTRTDPFTQSNELNRVKAEYLKARFDKELNVGDKPPQ